MSDSASKNMKVRPPIVVVMGHVDHGKTTLLDYIRKANVAAREAGGITQSIGAYEITHSGRKITFIDTPGHEAFSKMRGRGATAADLAILVVAADEGLKPQTMESLNTLNETKTPFIVAITKIDKPNADVEKIKNDLTSAGVLLEGYGGSISYQPVSAKSGEHVDDLLDLILLAADVEDLKFDPTVPATGYVLETRMDRRRGAEATVIVKNGTLRQGEMIATKTGHGKIRILENFMNKAEKALEPSAPALILGFEKLPSVGEEFVTGEAAKNGPAEAAAKPKGTSPVKKGEETLNLVLKASDAGSLEALSEILKAIATEKPIRIVSESVGDINDNDVNLALGTESSIVAFRSKIDKGSKMLAETKGVKVVSSEIIYELITAVEEALSKKKESADAGILEILAVFGQSKLDKQVVGGRVVSGVFRNKTPFEIDRSGAKVGQGRVQNLQQNKKDANSVSEGECGLMVNASLLIEKGDKLVIKNH